MKRMTHIILTALLFFGALTHASKTYAQSAIAGQSAQLVDTLTNPVDERVEKLNSFLKYHNSPMAEVSNAFVEIADTYHLDWKLVAAIAGVESTFGKHVPANSYNGWGWGIPTGTQSGLGFASWEQGIEVVSKGLKERYSDRGADSIEKMGAIYAPVSDTWAGKVKFFMEKIETYSDKSPDSLELLF